MIIKNVSINKLEQIAYSIAKNLSGTETILLVGDLAAGKTTFTKFLLSYFGIQRVKSPTFNLCHTYKAKFTFHHLDLYRINSQIDLSINEILEEDAVKIIEWPTVENFKEYLLIRFTIKDDLRDLEIINKIKGYKLCID